jgi:hypothetical protein
MLGNVSLNKRTFHFTKHSTNFHIFLYNRFYSLSQLWSYPSSDSPKKIPIRRVSSRQKNDPRKERERERRKEKEHKSKVIEVKPHLPIQGNGKLRYVASSIPTYHFYLYYLQILDFSLPPLHTKSFLINLDYMPHSSLEFSFAFTINKIQHRYLLRVNHVTSTFCIIKFCQARSALGCIFEI